MYIVDRIEGKFVILEYNGSFIEIEKNKLPDVSENDILYFKDNEYIKHDEKRDKIKRDIRSRFERLKG